MYKITKNQNKETGKKEYVISYIDLNIHPLIKDVKNFDTVFSREYARREVTILYNKVLADTITEEDMEKINLLISLYPQFELDINDISIEDVAKIAITSLKDVSAEEKSLMLLTLYAHDILTTALKYNDNTIALKCNITLGNEVNELYKACKKVVPALQSGTTTIEEAVKEIKPLYNKACIIINTNSSENTKKWIQSTKEKDTIKFILGLCDNYKITRANKLKTTSCIYKLEKFEKYFSMWLVTNCFTINRKNKIKSTETFESILNRL